MSKQLDLPAPRTWGGHRPGAGRKPSPVRPGPPHAPRPQHHPRHPVHVTLRARKGVPSLRSSSAFPTLCHALAASSCASFRVIHFSVQSDHLHLVVEASGRPALSRGMWGLTVRCARAINRCSARRGPVWSGRYHAHALRTPSEVRRALVYVLLNFRKHLRAPPGVDPRGSGPWFDGWLRPVPSPVGPCPVMPSRTWLASVGWRRAGGPIDFREAPALCPAVRSPRIPQEFPDDP